MIRNRPIFFFLAFRWTSVIQDKLLQSDLFVARIRRSYARFVHSEEIFFNERNISFPFPFYYFANDTTVARALQEDEIKNDFFFFVQGTFSPPPFPRTSRTGHGEIIAQGRRGIIHFFEHHYPLIFIQQRERGHFLGIRQQICQNTRLKLNPLIV